MANQRNVRNELSPLNAAEVLMVVIFFAGLMIGSSALAKNDCPKASTELKVELEKFQNAKDDLAQLQAELRVYDRLEKQYGADQSLQLQAPEEEMRDAKARIEQSHIRLSQILIQGIKGRVTTERLEQLVSCPLLTNYLEESELKRPWIAQQIRRHNNRTLVKEQSSNDMGLETRPLQNPRKVKDSRRSEAS